MTEAVSEALARATARLAGAGVESARHDAETLLALVVGTSRGKLGSRGHLDAESARAFDAAVARRAAREPLQHITGSAPFRYLELAVGSGVFIPRPETEVMAGEAITELNRLIVGGNAHPVAVDLCTGSGAVAISMATEAAGVGVTAVEISAAAHEYAERNAAGHDIDVRLGDIASAVDDLAGRVHVVTANPPYIPLIAFETVDAEAREFDPPLALWSGDDGLDTIRVVSTVAARLLVGGGLVACEHADVQAESAAGVFAASGEWADVRDHRDLAGRPRFVTARRVPRR